MQEKPRSGVPDFLISLLTFCSFAFFLEFHIFEFVLDFGFLI